ncbi:MAG: FAD-dependent thymidylate synthase [Clostridiales bacterium]|jgi:thymidylate synthase (FAD)|nr:FAD-dependent thymidylate synthase [Clostridiales bacterium]
MERVTGKAELIRYTERPEETVAAAARLCYSPEGAGEVIEKSGSADNARYIAMLKNMGHLSTFEHASFTFALTGVSRALLAQITRHRIASFSVRSQRYVDQSDFNYVLPEGIKNLPNADELIKKFDGQMRTIALWYGEWRGLLGGGGEKTNEDARFVLPNACETQLIVTMNARELLHFFSLRCCNRAQWEIRSVAWQMLRAASEVAPNLFASAGPACLNGVCPEGKKSCGKRAQVREYKDGLLKERQI